jgi:hypothetical protein
MDIWSWVIVLHVVLATAWFGGALFLAAVVGPALQKAGPQAGGFLIAVARRGGFSRYFLIIAGITILLGASLYYREGIQAAPFAGQDLWVTLGAILAIVAFLDGLFIIRPVDEKLSKLLLSLKGPPSAEQATQLQTLGKKIGMMSAGSTLMVLLALVFMVIRRLP